MKGAICALIVAGSVITNNTMAYAKPVHTFAQLESLIAKHVERRQPSFTVTVSPEAYGYVHTALVDALHSDDYLSHDYSADEYIGPSQIPSKPVVVKFRVTYRESESQYQYVLRRVSDILHTIIRPGMSDFQKEFVIHNYIVLHTAYDNTLQNVTPYDALTQGTTVCNGYAMLTYLMLKKAGIPNRIVDGYAGGESHSWNLLYIDGHYYNLDTTWDDPTPDEAGVVHFGYYNVTDAQLAEDHSWTTSGLPRASTDFVSVLARLSRGRSRLAANYRSSMLYSTNLYLELPQFTYNTMLALQTLLTASHKHTVTFRLQAALMPEVSMLNLTRSWSFNYSVDPRDRRYDIVVATS